jgi:hypothetical protein
MQNVERRAKRTPPPRDTDAANCARNAAGTRSGLKVGSPPQCALPCELGHQPKSTQRGPSLCPGINSRGFYRTFPECAIRRAPRRRCQIRTYAIRRNQRARRLRTPQGQVCASPQSSLRGEISLDCTPPESVSTVGCLSTSQVLRRRLKTAAIARTVRAQFLKRSDLSQPGRVSRPPILHGKRRRAATQTYMAIAPPST